MEKDELMMKTLPIPLQLGTSIINENPIGVLEKLGKYEFIYDYKVSSGWESILQNITFQGDLGSYSPVVKEGGSNANMIAPSGFWSGQSFPQPVKVNSEAQVGFFSKGNIVNVVRFDGNNAIIENVNYKAPDPTVVKTVFGEYLGGFLNKKEFSVPKDYLRKVDDTLSATILTGINYGANMKPQPVKTITSSGTQLGQLLETNVTYTIIKPFTFLKSYTNVRPLYELGGAGMLQYEQKANYDTLPIGIEVTGNLMSQMVSEKKSFSNMGVPPPPKYLQDVLVVDGMGQNGQLIIPVEYLTKKVSTNSGTVVPAKNNNKNLLMIAGAFFIGYALFSNGKSSN